MAGHEDNLPFLTRIADEIHRYGAVASIELNHAGMLRASAGVQAWGPDYINFDETKTIAPLSDQSASDEPVYRKGEVLFMTEEMIETVVDAFGRAAEQAKTCGFEMAMIHAGHGWRQKAVVRMPKGTTKTRFDNIAKEGATVTIEEVNYDDCVRMAAAEAAKTEHGIIVQDTAWDGYEEIPSWIMQGYGTLVLEADQQLKEMGVERPTHVFVQAGVGSLAGAVVGYFAHKYKDNPPVMAVCEASAADCLYRSAVAKTGNLVNVTGDLQTIMAGLACGEGNTIGWDILKNHVDVFASCPDWMSAKATRIYANPLGDDPHVVSGESGSVPLGFCFTALHDEDAKDLKEALKLDENSVVLVISTEGDTDPVRYREIVWDGLYGTNESLSK